MPILYEFNNAIPVDGPDSLRGYLVNLWENLSGSLPNEDPGSQESSLHDRKMYQPFLDFDGRNVTANNYVGYIQHENTFLELYPKVFIGSSAKANNVAQHLFFWLEYCSRWKFPFNKAQLDYYEHDSLPEMIIALMADYLYKAVGQNPLSQYIDFSEPINSPKGRINFSKYITDSYISGRHQQIHCDYQSYDFDNQVNRIIKHVSRRLLSVTKSVATVDTLQRILFILDEVEDQTFNASHLKTITFNSFFSEYEDVLVICRSVLEQSLQSSNKYDFRQWSLLFPMEYIFEDFIAGFLKRHYSNMYEIEYHKSDLTLSTSPKAFTMEHDILLTNKANPDCKIIIDTKYKRRDNLFKVDTKRGISQADLYQMTSYAFRRGCNEVLMIYPNIKELASEVDIFHIDSGFNPSDVIRVVAAEVPFWSLSSFDKLTESLKRTFDSLFHTHYHAGDALSSAS